MTEHSVENVRAPWPLLVAVFLLSASGLMFELTLTRIFSATIWYHYAFVAISVALFGWGLGGFLVFLLRLGRFRAQLIPILISLSLLLALALPAFLAGIFQFPFTPERLDTYFLLSLLPFLAGGAALSLAFEGCGDANRLYFADLLGAATGVLLVPATLSAMGAETSVLAIAALPALAALALCFTLPGRRVLWATICVLALAGALGLTGWNAKTGLLVIRDAPNKGLYQLLHASPGAKISSDRWNAYSRITSVTGFDDFHVARLYIDSDAWTNVVPWDGTRATPPGGPDWFRALPFRLTPNPSVLVIGPGGGTDVVLAVACGSPQVTAVEMNPLIVDCVRRLGPAAGNLYDHPKVRLVQQEGRNYIERTPEKFDLIVLGFVDSWAAIASGGLSLTENYLYTRDALAAYYDHLTEDGALVIIRWPVDVRRLVANSFDLLSSRGVSSDGIAQRIFAVAEKRPQGDEPLETVFMLARSPIQPEAIERMLAGHEQAHVLFAAAPDPAAAARKAHYRGEPQYTDLLSGKTTLAQYADSFDTLASPVVDDRPFYFATDKPLGIPDFVVRLFKTPARTVLIFVVLLVIAAWLTRLRVPGPRAWCYFGGLGLGFIICEIALLQRLILLLGHPIYTLVVLLFSLLLAGGLGSLAARRITAERVRAALAGIILGVIALTLLAAFALPLVVRAALPLDDWQRMLVAAGVVFPFGFLMGMPFPLGLRRFTTGDKPLAASTLWGINGVASVVGSMSAVLIAIVGGFSAVLLTGAACYGVALVARPK